MRNQASSLGLGALFVSMTFLAACSDTAKPDQAALASTASASTATSSSASAAPSAAPSASATSDATAATSASAAPSASAASAPTGAPSGGPSVASSSSAPAASSSAKADSGEVKGAENSGAAFSAYMTASKAYKAGQPGSVTAVVNALGEYHVNPEYPYKVKLGAAPAGVTFPEDTVRDVSRSEKRATMTIPFTPSQAGSATISGTISLSVCSKDQCVIEKAPVSVTVKVD